MKKLLVAGCMLLAAVSAYAEEKEFRIDLDSSAPIIKDLRKSTSAPDIGYAGDISAPGIFCDAYLSYVKNREATARIYRQAGVWLVRPCDTFENWRKIDANAGKDWVIDEKSGKCQWLNPKYNFSFYKEYGLRAIVCLNLWNDQHKDELDRFLAWIVDNGWADTVAGFEMCNEPFYGKDPEGYAKYWKAYFPIIKARLPNVKIGMPLAEYCPGDPDIEQAKARLLGEKKLSGDYFTANSLNQWSAKAVEAMGDSLTNVSHIVYHVYGANSAYGCSYSGFRRFRNFAKMFPQVADKRWWITEWRERSDENLQCQRQFRMVLWKGMYMQTALCQPELDGFTLHELTSLSGAFYSSPHGKWNQYYDDWENGRDWKAVAADELRYEVGGTGALFALYVQALKTHPAVMGYGSKKHGQNREGAFWAASMYYDNPKKYPDCQWTALLNAPHKSSICLLVSNTTDEEQAVPLTLHGRRLGSQSYRLLTCDERYLDAKELPGEEKPWKRIAWEDPLDDPLAPCVLRIPPRSVGTVMIAAREWDDWWRQHLGRMLVKRAVQANKGSYVECCGVRKGKLFMNLPDGQDVKGKTQASTLCEKIGKDKGFDAQAVEEAKSAGFEVCVDEKGKAAYLFKADQLPDSGTLKSRLQEMAGF